MKKLQMNVAQRGFIIQPRQGWQSIARGVSPWKKNDPNRISPEGATDIEKEEARIL
jgi:hypothetical protein